MERCPICGAAVRPGAKFCTSCGSRLDEKPGGSPQDTVVEAPAARTDDITPEPDWEAASGGAVPDETGDTVQDVADDTGTVAGSEPPTPDPDNTWGNRWPEPRDSDDETSHATWSWATPETTGDAAWRTGNNEEGATGTESPASATPDDEPQSGSTEPATSAAEPQPDSDPRQQASDLLDELRGLVWQIGAGQQSGVDDASLVQDIRRVRGETSDFADLAPVITAVRENPRDIDALRDLGQKVTRLNDLLESHRRLVTTLEDILRDQ